MKKIFLQIFKFTYFAGCFWYLFTIPAQAYIDPSVISYIIQVTAAVLITLGVMVTVSRHKIMALFKKNSKKAAKREIHLKEDNADSENSEQ